MLTIEMLRQNPTLSALTEEQIKAIAVMSKNDENTVIGTRIGELHGQYDTDIFSITGIRKKDSEKSYDYAKRVLASYKTKVEYVTLLEDKLSKAKTQVEDLTKKLEKGATDASIVQQLKDAKTQVEQLQERLTAKETELTTKEGEYKANLQNLQVDYAFQEAVSGLKFKDSITEAIKNVILDSAKKEVLAKGTPEFTGEGANKVLVFRGADGNILNNPKNNLNPYSFKELVLETSLKDIIDVGHEQKGGGTGSKGGVRDKGSALMLDFTGVKTQLEADKMIEQHLLSNGLTRDSQEFAEQLGSIRTENNIANLPIR